MNYSAYVFGDLGLGYTQYPDDFTKGIYQNIVSSSNVNTQIAIYRDSNLVYYVYHRRLTKVSGNENYIGIAISFNDVYCNDIKYLFSVFEDTITNLVVAGKILKFTDDGDISANDIKLYQIRNEIDRITSALSLSIDKIPYKSFVKLPAINYGVNKNEKNKLPASVTPSEIDSNIRLYNQLYILKNENFDSQELSGYAGKIRSFNQQIKKLTQDNSNLLSELERLKKQKKQVTKVVFLVIALSLCIIGLLFFRSNVQRLSSEIAEQKLSISKLSGKVQSQSLCIDSLQSLSTSRLATIHSLNTHIEELDEVIERRNYSLDSASSAFSNYRESISRSYPLYIKDIEVGNLYKGGGTCNEYGTTIYSSSSMYLSPRIRYEGNISGDITLNVKLYRPNGTLSEGSPKGYSFSDNEYISTGDHYLSLSGWGGENKGHWSAGTYRFEIWYGDICLKAKTFTLY